MWILHAVHKDIYKPLLCLFSYFLATKLNQPQAPVTGSLGQHQGDTAQKVNNPCFRNWCPSHKREESCIWARTRAHSDRETQVSNALGYWHIQSKSCWLSWGMAQTRAEMPEPLSQGQRGASLSFQRGWEKKSFRSPVHPQTPWLWEPNSWESRI